MLNFTAVLASIVKIAFDVSNSLTFVWSVAPIAPGTGAPLPTASPVVTTHEKIRWRLLTFDLSLKRMLISPTTRV